jgi:hypothetical protein
MRAVFFDYRMDTETPFYLAPGSPARAPGWFKPAPEPVPADPSSVDNKGGLLVLLHSQRRPWPAWIAWAKSNQALVALLCLSTRPSEIPRQSEWEARGHNTDYFRLRLPSEDTPLPAYVPQAFYAKLQWMVNEFRSRCEQGGWPASKDKWASTFGVFSAAEERLTRRRFEALCRFLAQADVGDDDRALLEEATGMGLSAPDFAAVARRKWLEAVTRRPEYLVWQDRRIELNHTYLMQELRSCLAQASDDARLRGQLRDWPAKHDELSGLLERAAEELVADVTLQAALYLHVRGNAPRPRAAPQAQIPLDLGELLADVRRALRSLDNTIRAVTDDGPVDRQAIEDVVVALQMVLRVLGTYPRFPSNG